MFPASWACGLSSLHSARHAEEPHFGLISVVDSHFHFALDPTNHVVDCV